MILQHLSLPHLAYFRTKFRVDGLLLCRYRRLTGFIRPDVDEAYEQDKAALKQAIPANPDAVYAITVGSEALYRGNLTGPELLTKINDMEATFPGVKVGTADSWNKYADGTADALITGGVKLL